MFGCIESVSIAALDDIALKRYRQSFDNAPLFISCLLAAGLTELANDQYIREKTTPVSVRAEE
jgi:hypothetical protein